MDEKEIFEKLKDILEDKFNFDKNKIKFTSELAKDIGIDSFAAVELAFMLEDEFKIKIPDEEFYKLKTIDDAVKAIAKKMQ